MLFWPLSLQKFAILAPRLRTRGIFSAVLQHFVKIRGKIVFFLLGTKIATF